MVLLRISIRLDIISVRGLIGVYRTPAYNTGDHPFKTSAFFRGEGVKNLPNLPTDSSKKLPTEGSRVKNRENLLTSLMDGP